MGTIRNKRRICLKSLNASIREVQEAIRFLERANTDQAEAEIGDSIVDISRTLRCLKFNAPPSRPKIPKRKMVLKRRCR